MQKIDFSNTFNYINQCMKVTFNFSLILLTIILIFSLVLWLIGIRIKSEKAIKMGIRMSVSTLLLNALMIGIVLVIANFR